MSNSTLPAPPHPDCVVIGDAGVTEGWQEGDVPEPQKPKPTGTPFDPVLDQVDEILDIFDPPGQPRRDDDE